MQTESVSFCSGVLDSLLYEAPLADRWEHKAPIAVFENLPRVERHLIHCSQITQYYSLIQNSKVLNEILLHRKD